MINVLMLVIGYFVVGGIIVFVAGVVRDGGVSDDYSSLDPDEALLVFGWPVFLLILVLAGMPAAIRHLVLKVLR